MNTEENDSLPDSQGGQAPQPSEAWQAPEALASSDAVSLQVPEVPEEPASWTRVSVSYAWADLVLNLMWVIVVAAVFAGVYWLNDQDLSLVALIAFPCVVVVMVINALLAFRRVKAIGYILREDDLLFRRGIMFERVIAVPYGRLQLVDVTRGPLLRALGLSTLKFVTASAATGVQLPGLKAEDAEALRDRLVELAEIRRSGL